MKVKEVMTRAPRSCSVGSNCAAAASLMWEADCGVIPVVDRDGKVKGLITDRDICVAAATRGATPGSIPVSDVISGKVYSCTSEDDVQEALKSMAEHCVRRLPVVDSRGKLEGIVSINDLILAAQSGGRAGKIPQERILETLQSLCAHPASQVRSAASAARA